MTEARTCCQLTLLVTSLCSESSPAHCEASGAPPAPNMVQCCQAASSWKACQQAPGGVFQSPQVVPQLLPLRCRWDGYLSVLPSSLPGLPCLWPASDQALLEGTALLDKLRGSLALRGGFVEPPSQVCGGESLLHGLLVPN